MVPNHKEIVPSPGHADESQQAGAEEPGGGGDGDGCCLDPWVNLARSPSQKIVL